MYRILSENGSIWYINLVCISAIDTKNNRVYLQGDEIPIRLHSTELSLLLAAIGVKHE